MLRIACYGIQPNEAELFQKFNEYDYELSIFEKHLSFSNLESTKNHDAVLVRTGSIVDTYTLRKFQDFGIEYIYINKTDDQDIVDLDEAKKLGLNVVFVPTESEERKDTMLKIACYGVRPNEVDSFHKYNTYNYDLTLYEEYLNHDNVETAKGHNAVLLRANCAADAKNLAKFKEYGIEYVFTRTVGYDFIDVEEAKRLGMKVAFVPAYSPNAIAELGLTFGMTLLRNIQYTAHQSSVNLDFRVTPQMFSPEVRKSTVGIIGTGRIGLEEAKMYKAMGARVLGYDLFQSDAAKEVVEFVEQDTLLNESDIVSLHVPHIPGENDEMINAEFIGKMKDGAILINTARGALQDNQAVIDAIKSNKLSGFGTDVLPNEGEFFFKKFDSIDDIEDETVRELINLYPRVLITPHIGSNTHEALKDMISVSYENFNDVLTTGTSVNIL